MLLFDGSSDPIEHLKTYRAHLSLRGTPNEIACWVFPLTLKDNVRDRFGRLPPNSIDNFDNLRKMFISQFIAGRKRKKPSTYLFTLKQRQTESLGDFIIRFNHEKLTVDDPKEDLVFDALLNGILA
jgi:hypothetical protein